MVVRLIAINNTFISMKFSIIINIKYINIHETKNSHLQVTVHLIPL